MKNTLLGMSIVAVLAIVSCEKEKPSNLYTDAEKEAQASSIVDPATAPVLTFETATYDFGNLPSGANVEHYFKFTNTGKSPLVIKDAKGSCGCTVPVWPKNPIAPGVSDSIKIEYKAGSQQGSQRKTVTLTTNTVKGKEELAFTATLPTQPQTEETKKGAGALSH